MFSAFTAELSDYRSLIGLNSVERVSRPEFKLQAHSRATNPKMTPSEKRFIDGWRIASPVLEKIRHEELRKLDEHAGARMISKVSQGDHALNGLAIFQSWMMRLRVLEMMKKSAE